MKRTKIVALPCNCCGASQWNYEFSEHQIDLGSCGNCGLHYIAQMPTREKRVTDMQKSRFAGDQIVADAQLHKNAEVRQIKKFQYLVLTKFIIPL